MDEATIEPGLSSLLPHHKSAHDLWTHIRKVFLGEKWPAGSTT